MRYIGSIQRSIQLAMTKRFCQLSECQKPFNGNPQRLYCSDKCKERAWTLSRDHKPRKYNPEVRRAEAARYRAKRKLRVIAYFSALSLLLPDSKWKRDKDFNHWAGFDGTGWEPTL